LVIGPLTSATLRVVPSAQHGIASAAVVVARMIGMLVGMASLSAWGLYRFNQFFAERLAALPAPNASTPGGLLIAQGVRLRTATTQAFVMQYGEMFGITAIVCIIGAVLALFISGRKEHADEPIVATEVAADDSGTDMVEARPDLPSGERRH
jgi:hypothetical protein